MNTRNAGSHGFCPRLRAYCHAVFSKLNAAHTGSLGACVAAVFLTGALVVEWPVLVFLLPVVAGLVFVYGLRYEQLSESFLILLLTVGLAGMASAGTVGYLLYLSEDRSIPFSLRQTLEAFLQTLKNDVAAGLPKNDWISAVLLPAMALITAVFANRRTTACTDEITLWKWRGGAFVFSLFALATSLNLPHTVWAVARKSAHLPVLPSLDLFEKGIRRAKVRSSIHPAEPAEGGLSDAHSDRGRRLPRP